MHRFTGCPSILITLLLFFPGCTRAAKDVAVEGTSSTAAPARLAPDDSDPNIPWSLPPTTSPGSPPSVSPPAASPPNVGDAPTVKMAVLPETRLVRAQVASYLNFVVRLQGKTLDQRERPPVDLALIIDRSGSMAGAKLPRVKQAALALIARLGDADRVTLISYAGGVSRHTTRRRVDDGGRALLRREILAMKADGSTALGPALTSTLRIMERGARRRGVLAHVMLLSDGRANVGETRPPVLAARAASAFSRGVSLSTLGVGLDFNDHLMIALATQGGGNYHFVEHNDQISKVLDAETRILANAVARRMVLRLSLSQGVTLDHSYGYATTSSADGVHVRVGALRSGQVRNIVLRLRLPATHQATLSIGEFHLSYRDVERSGLGSHLQQRLTLRTSPQVSAVVGSVRPDVVARVREVEGAADLNRATNQLDRGRLDQAQQTLDRALRRLRQQQRATPRPRLKRMIRQLQTVRGQIHKVHRKPRSAPSRKRFMLRNRFDPYSNLQQ